MSPFTMVLRWMVGLMMAAHLVAAVPQALSACPGNLCYPVLVGPLKSIATDFCNYYLHYPKTTTVTVKTTSTTTKATTLPTSTTSVTKTVTKTVSTRTTSTTTKPGSTITSTVTETTTVIGLAKRVASPLWAPPVGSPAGYVPPELSTFLPAVISAACSCLVHPTTTTISTTSKATATVTSTSTPPPKTVTVSTTTTTVTSTITVPATTTAAPSTTTVTVTSTVTNAPLQPTCTDASGPPILRATGFVQGNPDSSKTTTEESADACRATCISLANAYITGGAPYFPKSFAFTIATGQCVCYNPNVCAYFTIDPAGDTIAGDDFADLS